MVDSTLVTNLKKWRPHMNQKLSSMQITIPKLTPQIVNRVINTMIRSYIKDNHQSWDENLHKFGFALRTAVHEVTGFSPAYLNFGRES